MLINKNSSSKFLKRFNAKINFDLIDNNGRFKQMEKDINNINNTNNMNNMNNSNNSPFK